MFGMTAFIDDLEVCLVAAAEADQNVCFVVFTEVRTKTALSTLNGFHDLFLLWIAVGEILPTLLEHTSMSFAVCKLRLHQSSKLRTVSVLRSFWCRAAR